MPKNCRKKKTKNQKKAAQIKKKLEKTAVQLTIKKTINRFVKN